MCTDHFLEDVICLGGPDKGLGIHVVDSDAVPDGVDELANAANFPLRSPCRAQ